MNYFCKFIFFIVRLSIYDIELRVGMFNVLKS